MRNNVVQLHTKRYEPVIARMSFKRETPEPIEQRDEGKVRHPRAMLRKRILAIFLIVVSGALMSVCVYYQSAYQRSASELSWFWVGEVIVGVLVISGIVRVLRKGP
jgi:hypothetical protein